MSYTDIADREMAYKHISYFPVTIVQVDVFGIKSTHMATKASIL